MKELLAVIDQDGGLQDPGHAFGLSLLPYDDRLALLTREVEPRPENRCAWDRLGLLYGKLGMLDEAKHAYQVCLELVHGSPICIKYYADCIQMLPTLSNSSKRDSRLGISMRQVYLDCLHTLDGQEWADKQAELTATHGERVAKIIVGWHEAVKSYCRERLECPELHSKFHPAVDPSPGGGLGGAERPWA